MQISVYLNEKEYVALKREAAKEGDSMNRVMRLALRKHLDLPLFRAEEHDRNTYIHTLAREARVR